MICFHKYTAWSDVLVFKYVSQSYVLQGKKCLKCNHASFQTIKAKSTSLAECAELTEEKLKQARLWAQLEEGVAQTKLLEPKIKK